MDNLANQYFLTREQTREICAPLEIEDHVAQPFEDVSPPKWHLGHTTWFFEKFILSEHLEGYRSFSGSFDKIFNSYYKTVGEHWRRDRRGALSRPTVERTLEYRAYVDVAMGELLNSSAANKEVMNLLEVGIHHENQHQELLYMDIKAILFNDPEDGAYLSPPTDLVSKKYINKGEDWLKIPEGKIAFGAGGEGFSYDNEKPRHCREVPPALVRADLVTNGEFLEFMDSGGYQRPELWLSLGWEWVQRRGIRSPMYWIKEESGFAEHTLYGKLRLNPDWPVQHISLFEADAFAKWRGLRLPTEFELEYLCSNQNEKTPRSGPLNAVDKTALIGELWNWTMDQYVPYPGYESYEGSLGEYNSKFMCNQFVLRGGCYVTPENHFRPTYRNYYEPWQRWMCSGMRLAKSSKH